MAPDVCGRSPGSTFRVSRAAGLGAGVSHCCRSPGACRWAMASATRRSAMDRCQGPHRALARPSGSVRTVHRLFRNEGNGQDGIATPDVGRHHCPCPWPLFWACGRLRRSRPDTWRLAHPSGRAGAGRCCARYVVPQSIFARPGCCWYQVATALCPAVMFLM